MVFPLTTRPERVGIVTTTAGTATTELFETLPSGDAVAWVDGCSFQIQTPAENQDIETTTTSETAFCYMPSSDGTVITIDGQAIPASFITSKKRLRQFSTGLDYVMRGDAVFELGKSPHVFIHCERQNG